MTQQGAEPGKTPDSPLGSADPAQPSLEAEAAQHADGGLIPGAGMAEAAEVSAPASFGASKRKFRAPSAIPDYAAACQFADSLVDYEKLAGPPRREEDFKLDRVHELLALLGNPGRGQRFIQVAGTKGKGSTCAILSSLLTEAGLKVGMYTSPHLVSVRERIRFEGQPVGERDFLHLARRLLPAVEKMAENEGVVPTFFEALLAMALLHFGQQKADVSILEVGLGGRLDATSVVSPLVAVITSISRDHTAILGNTLAEIAREKAGIVKEEAVVVSSAQEMEVREALLRCVRGQRAILFLGNEDFFFQGRAYSPTSTRFDYFGLSHTWEGLEVSLAGPHQAENASTALATLECLDELWGFPLKEEAIRRGLEKVCWPGRLEIASWQPLVVLDGAHNPCSAQALKTALGESFSQRKVVLVFGTGQDKEYREMAEILWPGAERIIVTQSSHPRALDAARLVDECRDLTDNAMVLSDHRRAFQEALLVAGREGLVCVTGSLFLVGDIKAELEGVKAVQEQRLTCAYPAEEQLPLFDVLAEP